MPTVRSARVVAVALLLPVVILTVGSAQEAAAAPTLDPCELPGVGTICGVPGDIVGAIGGQVADGARSVGDSAMHSITEYVTKGAVWFTSSVGGLIDETTTPNLEADWFQSQYRAMTAIAGAFALPLLLASFIRSVFRGQVAESVRSALVYLPIAVVATLAATAVVDLLVLTTDSMTLHMTTQWGGDTTNALEAIGTAYTAALDDESQGAMPLFAIALVSVFLALGSVVLWLEMQARNAGIYIVAFFLPLTYVALVWETTRHYARRLTELLIGLILCKFVVVSILVLATAAFLNLSVIDVPAGGSTDPGIGGSAPSGTNDGLLGQMVAGAALVLMSAYSPLFVLRFIPGMIDTALAAGAGVGAMRGGTAKTFATAGATVAGGQAVAAAAHSVWDRSAGSGGTGRGGGPGAASGFTGARSANFPHIGDLAGGQNGSAAAEPRASSSYVGTSGGESAGSGGRRTAPPGGIPPGAGHRGGDTGRRTGGDRPASAHAQVTASHRTPSGSAGRATASVPAGDAAGRSAGASVEAAASVDADETSELAPASTGTVSPRAFSASSGARAGTPPGLGELDESGGLDDAGHSRDASASRPPLDGAPSLPTAAPTRPESGHVVHDSASAPTVRRPTSPAQPPRRSARSQLHVPAATDYRPPQMGRVAPPGDHIAPESPGRRRWMRF